MNFSIVDLGFCKTETQAARYFHFVIAEMDETAIEEPDFFENILNACTASALRDGKSEGSIRNLRGNWFEFAIGLSLIKKGVVPHYHRASLSHVPNVIFDFIIFTREHGPICLSAKTSLRERYKQTDLEAMALKYVHRRSISYLLTVNEERTVTGLARKINNREVLGLDGVYRSGEIQDLVTRLQSLTLVQAPRGDIVQGNIITRSL